VEEILEVKELIQKHDYKGALKLVEELEYMSNKAEGVTRRATTLIGSRFQVFMV